MRKIKRSEINECLLAQSTSQKNQFFFSNCMALSEYQGTKSKEVYYKIKKI